jgi:transcription-repair coupling factor (superfamily II helicase)
MDRLVCGDVGFGKTEVAIRAAYKCVRHGRQVAVLVPTTILVEQHRKNFVNRFQEYDVNIAAMSRFNSVKKNKEIIEGAKNGTIDIVLGTHRLLSKDVAFKDLGLLIIDEEHRFGVKQKEQLKALKRSIDVLTLTATPIPRTLHMSLLGIRDISVIQTPPQDRRSIRTYVANFDMSLVRDAILREIQRGGQVFYLHNRVQSIDAVTATLKEHIPEATFRFAHGQMSETQLESIMIDFIDRKFDVLVCTTIVESGIDIPNANTLIIERADTFGLAQLYQIRGRVGRSTRQAYAYLLVQKTKNLSDDARRRLSALQSLDELGMGFNLAMQDLEIRGAGNLLGKEQSGNVLAIGFDLYTKILKEAILHVKGEELDLSEIIDPEVKLPIAAFIPETYIPDISERLIMYQRLSGIETDLETEDLLTEIDDRFGPPPKEVRSLLNLMKLRALLRRFGITKLELQGDGITLSLSKRAPVDLNKIMDLCKKFPDTFKFGKSLTLSIRLKSPDRFEPDEIHPLVEEALFRIKS